MSIKENLVKLKETIPDGVRLVAVSKFHPAEAVLEACAAGQLLFGENRVQEAAEKFDEVRKTRPEAELHIIGQLQRNKVKEAVRVASCIESVDRLELLLEIEKQCAKIGKTVEILFELHTGEESKSGFVDKDALFGAIRTCADGKTPHIVPKGFMTMAPFTDDEALIRASFRKLKSVQSEAQKEFSALSLAERSMGMSGDYKIAIEEGSTIVRIGTAIFGAREY